MALLDADEDEGGDYEEEEEDRHDDDGDVGGGETMGGGGSGGRGQEGGVDYAYGGSGEDGAVKTEDVPWCWALGAAGVEGDEVWRVSKGLQVLGMSDVQLARYRVSPPAAMQVEHLLIVWWLRTLLSTEQ